MGENFLITGSPGSGKTTVLQSTISILEEEGVEVGGIYCPEIREGGRRKGFKIIDIISGESKILAHVNTESGPKVSKYRVNVDNVDEISKSAISKSLKDADVTAIDEIAPMETYSKQFKKQVKDALGSKKPLLAVIHKKSKTGFIGEIKNREDCEKFEVNKKTRDDLPGKLSELILDSLN